MPAEYPPDDPYTDIERQQQSLLWEAQDNALNSISRTVSTLQEQAVSIGTHVSEQIDMVRELGDAVDSSDLRLSSARQTMDRFVRQNVSSRSSWCILLLIIVLVFLLFALIFF